MPGTTLAESPYKGLMPYAKEDAAFFFGRERERELITANLMASRFTLLYGASGVGKSSVINAGVVWYLQEQAKQVLANRGTPESVVIAFNSWRDDPLALLKHRISSMIEDVWPGKRCEGLDAAPSFADYLARWTECLDGELLIILDQFEEYFLYHSQELGERSFAVELPRAINRPDLRVNFLISIREDALAKLDLFKGRIPNLFDTYLRIEHLDREAARSAIAKPIDQFNALTPADRRVSIEPELIEAVLDQVKIGQVFLTTAGRGVIETADQYSQIETPYLQLVMTRLWMEEMTAGSHALRLETLERLGGAAKIVRTHLDTSLSSFSPNEQDTAAQVFKYLVTPSGSKIALTVADLASYTELVPARVSSILERLASHEVRILKPINPFTGSDTATRYEIFHDVLAASILDWQARHAYSRDLAAVQKNILSIILPLFLGLVCDLLICFIPGGALIVWLMLRREKLALKRQMVNSIAVGWLIGWGLGWIFYVAAYFALLFEILNDVDSKIEGLILWGIFAIPRFFGPIGGVLAFLRWRKKARAKLATKPALRELPTHS